MDHVEANITIVGDNIVVVQHGEEFVHNKAAVIEFKSIDDIKRAMAGTPVVLSLFGSKENTK